MKRDVNVSGLSLYIVTGLIKTLGLFFSFVIHFYGLFNEKIVEYHILL